MSDWVGRTVSKVEVQKLLGRGGMAEVYLGRHMTLNRPVAVKVLQAHLSDDASLLSRFETEAQAVAAMRHPNIVQVFDFDVVDDRPYMVMELLQGPSLRDYLTTQHASNRRLPPRTISRLIASLASALDYAHARGIVHRDIKPANVMLRRETGPIDASGPLPADTEPVLTDFGVARIANAAMHTASGTIIGTPAYMSPEQVRGAIIDARSDIYSLGIVLYEMLAGRVPFSSDTQASILLQQINDPPPPLPDEYSELQSVLDRVLAKDPGRRFQKATDLAAVVSATFGLPGEPGATEPRISREALLAAESTGVSTVRLAEPTRGDMTPIASPTTLQPPPGTNLLWIVAAIGALALVVGLAALGITLLGGRGGPAVVGAGTPGITASPPAGGGGVSGPPVGSALFRDAGFSAQLSGLDAPPQGSFYQAWLIGPQAQPLSLGKLPVFEGRASISFTSPDGSFLLPQYSGTEISLEQGSEVALKPGRVVYIGQVDATLLKNLQTLAEVAPNTPLKTAVLNGVNSQVKVYDTHIDNTIHAIGNNDLALSKLHAEHVVNITVGQNDPAYGDLNGDGKVQNPGDGVGFRVYLKLLEETIRAAADAPDAGQDVQATASDLTQRIGQVLTILDQAVRIEQSITAADTIDEIKGDANQLNPLHAGGSLGGLTDKANTLNLGLSVEVRPAAP